MALEDQSERLVEVQWTGASDSTFLVQIEVEALDRNRLLSDVVQVLSDHHLNILGAHVSTNYGPGRAQHLLRSRWRIRRTWARSSAPCAASTACTTRGASPASNATSVSAKRLLRPYRRHSRRRVPAGERAPACVAAMSGARARVDPARPTAPTTRPRWPGRGPPSREGTASRFRTSVTGDAADHARAPRTRRCPSRIATTRSRKPGGWVGVGTPRNRDVDAWREQSTSALQPWTQSAAAARERSPCGEPPRRARRPAARQTVRCVD